MSEARAAAHWRPNDLWRTFAGLGVVLGAAALTLTALDAVPSWVAGEPRDVRLVPSVEEAERRLHGRLLLPGYFPDTIEWPPVAVRVRGGPAPGAALSFDGRRGGAYRMLAQAMRPGAVPERLLPAVNVLDRAPLWLQGEQVWLRRFVGPDGQVWRELRWHAKGRELALRSRGTVEEMVRMAKTVREEP